MQNCGGYSQTLDVSEPHLDVGMSPCITSGRPELLYFESSGGSSVEGRLFKTPIGGQFLNSLSAGWSMNSPGMQSKERENLSIDDMYGYESFTNDDSNHGAQQSSRQASMRKSAPNSSGMRLSAPNPSGMRHAAANGLGVEYSNPNTPLLRRFTPAVPDMRQSATSAPGMRLSARNETEVQSYSKASGIWQAFANECVMKQPNPSGPYMSQQNPAEPYVQQTSPNSSEQTQSFQNSPSTRYQNPSGSGGRPPYLNAPENRQSVSGTRQPYPNSFQTRQLGTFCTRPRYSQNEISLNTSMPGSSPRTKNTLGARSGSEPAAPCSAAPRSQPQQLIVSSLVENDDCKQVSEKVDVINHENNIDSKESDSDDDEDKTCCKVCDGKNCTFEKHQVIKHV